MEKIVKGINGSLSDVEKFAIVYYRLSKLIKEYDHSAGSDDTYSKEHAIYYSKTENTSRNLSEGLIEQEGFDLVNNSSNGTLGHRCVCAGYADILKNALAMVGVESIIDSGYAIRKGTLAKPTYTGGHEWNKVRIDGKWYYADLCWDRGERVGGRGIYKYALRGSTTQDYFRDENPLTSNTKIGVGGHYTCVDSDARGEEMSERPYDQDKLKELFDRIKEEEEKSIVIPKDPDITAEIVDSDRISEEYKRRKNDMYAKFYGDRGYQREYMQRSARFRSHEIETTDNISGITYRTIEDYDEREEDEKFLLLDKYAECLERLTRHEAGDTSVYTGTADQINTAMQKDRDYVETRNHTFDQHRNTQRDLATLGKYGERVAYIPKQNGIIRNIGRVVGNIGIFLRNAVSPIYRGIGRYIAQPVHRIITRGREASPYRNNLYHRMVARRDYFAEVNSRTNPGHPIRNAVKTRADAIFRASEGNEAVLRAGASDIRDNILNQERERNLINSCNSRVNALNTQIRDLEQEIAQRPNAKNKADVQKAIEKKKDKVAELQKEIESRKRTVEGDIQTDAISDEQHAIASKEVNTMRVTAIKGVAKGLAVRYVGPKIHEWLLERGKVVKPTQVTIETPETKTRWVDTTYRTENVPVYEDMIDTGRNMRDIIGANKGKKVTGFYSVYGGERRPATYTLSGNEKITAIFQAQGKGGTGLSDKIGLRAPTLTDRTFSSNLLTSKGLLNQEATVDELIQALNTGTVDASNLGDLYVSVGDRYWTKLSDLLGSVSKKVQVGEEARKVVDVAGHYEDYTEMVKKVIDTTEVVTNPAVVRAANIGARAGEGAVMIDGVLDVAENLRKTTTEVKSNKKKPRKYEFDEEVEDIPKSRREYRRQVEEREER